MTARKGARTRADVTPAILAQLNDGSLETASLPEMLVIDFPSLLHRAAPEIPETARLKIRSDIGVVQRMQLAGGCLHEYVGIDGLTRFTTHPSDTVRGWAAYLIAAVPEMTLDERLQKIRPLADDAHFGVREWAWMAIRPHFSADLMNAIALLQPWTTERSEFLRRFAVESIRPRGVWCSHISALKENPAPAQPLLESLRADPTKYVQDSVANWLNDAAKSKPDWVRKLCARWRKQSKTPATERICKRALRSLEDA